MSSGCKDKMVLIRMLAFQCMTDNVEVFAQYIKSKDNKYADMLSRGQIEMFKEEAKKNQIEIDDYNTDIPHQMWPMSKLWK